MMLGQRIIESDEPHSKHARRWMCASLLLLSLVALAARAAVPKRDEARPQPLAANVDPSIERLIQFAAEGDAATVELLLAAGVSASSADGLRKVTPLHNAAAQGHARLVQRFIEIGADVDALDWDGNSPLINAAYHGREAVVKILIARNAQIDIRPSHGPTALIAAIQQGSLPIVELLLAAGANPNLADAAGQSPLAAAERSSRTAIAARLRAVGAGAAP